jgi:hypothetical protein
MARLLGEKSLKFIPCLAGAEADTNGATSTTAGEATFAAFAANAACICLSLLAFPLSIAFTLCFAIIFFQDEAVLGISIMCY